MALLWLWLAACFAIATVAQTKVEVDEDDNLRIEKVIHVRGGYDPTASSIARSRPPIKTITIAPTEGHNFAITRKESKVVKDKVELIDKVMHIGRYMGAKDNMLQFRTKAGRSNKFHLYTFQTHVLGGHVRYNEQQISPTSAYIVNGHGSETKLEWKEEGGAWEPSRARQWKHSSTVYFFTGAYHSIMSETGALYAMWAEQGHFDWLKATVNILHDSERYTDNTQRANAINEVVGEAVMEAKWLSTKEGPSTLAEKVNSDGRVHDVWVTHGKGFEAITGVYRVVRKDARWQTQLIMYFPKTEVDKVTTLQDIVVWLETNYGAGDVYWLGCRSPIAIKEGKHYSIREDSKLYRIGPEERYSLDELAEETKSALKKKGKGIPGLQRWREKHMKPCREQWVVYMEALQKRKQRMTDETPDTSNVGCFHWLYQTVYKKWLTSLDDAMKAEVTEAAQRCKKATEQAIDSINPKPEFTAYNCPSLVSRVVEVRRRTDEIRIANEQPNCEKWWLYEKAKLEELRTSRLQQFSPEYYEQQDYFLGLHLAEDAIQGVRHCAADGTNALTEIVMPEHPPRVTTETPSCFELYKGTGNLLAIKKRIRSISKQVKTCQKPIIAAASGSARKQYSNLYFY